MNKFSVAIPTYNSSDYIEDCLKGFINSKFVNEIIICDDYSNQEEVVKLKNVVSKYLSKDVNIKLFEANSRKGAFDNKFKAISKCKNDFVYQIDSDNIPGKNIDQVLKKYLFRLDKNKIIYPAKLIQFRKYPRLANILKNFNKKYQVWLSNEDIDFDISKIKKSILEEENYLIDKNIFWVLNCGNFITSKEKYLSIAKAFNNNNQVPLSADAVALSYLWLSSGGVIYLDKEMYHYHRKRNDSVSFTEGDGTSESMHYFKKKILEI